MTPEMPNSFFLWLSLAEVPLAQSHINFAPPKYYAFGFETEALFDGGIAAQFDFSARTQYALPRQSERAFQDSCDQSCPAGQSRCLGNCAIG